MDGFGTLTADPFAARPDETFQDLLPELLGRSKLREVFPDQVVHHSWLQKFWLWRALRVRLHSGQRPLELFSEADYQELFLDISFRLQQALYEHYWERETRLRWEEFLSLTQGREDIEAAAKRVLLWFPDICPPNLGAFDDWGGTGQAEGTDYASRSDLLPEEENLLAPIVSRQALRTAVSMLVHNLEDALFLREKRQHPFLGWREFHGALEVEPSLLDAFALQVRWLFDSRLDCFKALWECELVTVPPLRIT